MSVRIIEVGPRDGLQNEAAPIPTKLKVDFIRALIAAGLSEIEVTSFVSPKWVPQLADSAEVFSAVKDLNGVFSVLVPNMKGLERAKEVGVERIALFTAASDAFTQKNINMTVAESLAGFGEVLSAFPNGWVRGYVSTAFECPYAGRIEPAKTVEVAYKLIEMGVDEVSIGDTIGVAVPSEVRTLTALLLKEIPAEKIAYHFHDTRGTAIANVQVALDLGITAFDSSAGGLGGCPYAPGAGGNLSTEDLVYLLERSGIPTGVNLPALAQASLPILTVLNRPPRSKSQIAVLAGSAHTY